MKHYDVLIATPGHSMNAGYVKSLMETVEELDKRGLKYKWLNAYSSLVGNAREATMSGDGTMNPGDKGPLKDKVRYKKIFWIDSDIEWSVKDFFKLYDSEEDIISGGYLIYTGKTSSVHSAQFPQGIPKEEVLKMNSIVPVDAVGFGFISIKEGVFEKIDRPWFGHLGQMIQGPNGKQIPISIGEDVSWCIKAKAAGFKIMFDPSVLVGHIKTSTISWQ